MTKAQATHTSGNQVWGPDSRRSGQIKQQPLVHFETDLHHIQWRNATNLLSESAAS